MRCRRARRRSTCARVSDGAAPSPRRRGGPAGRRPTRPPALGRWPGAAAAPRPATARAAGSWRDRMPPATLRSAPARTPRWPGPRSRPPSRRAAGRRRPGKDAQVGVEQRVPTVQVPAHDVGQAALGPVAQHGHLGPWRHVHEAVDGDDLGLPDPTHPMLVAVGEHDDVTGGSPVAGTLPDGDPASSGRDDVEEDHPIGAGAQQSGSRLPRQRLVGPRLAVLRPQEDRALQGEPLDRGPHVLRGSCTHRGHLRRQEALDRAHRGHRSRPGRSGASAPALCCTTSHLVTTGDRGSRFEVVDLPHEPTVETLQVPPLSPSAGLPPAAGSRPRCGSPSRWPGPAAARYRESRGRGRVRRW